MTKKLARLITAAVCAAMLVPGSALAHDGGDRGGHHWRHHHGVTLLGTVASVNKDNGTVVVNVSKASRKGRALVGDAVTVRVFRGKVADVNNDGKHNLADVSTGDKVLVKTLRRFVDADAKTVSAAKLIDLTHPTSRGSRDGDRDGDHT